MEKSMGSLWRIFHSEEVIDIEVLEDSLKTYHLSTGIKIFAIDEKGQRIASCGEKEEFCEFFKECTKESCSCEKAHLHASKQSEIIGEGYIFFCPAGLVHYSAPIMKNKVFRGALIAGPILMDYPDEVIVDDIIKNNELMVNSKGRIISYLKGIPIVEPERVRYLSKLLFTVTFNLLWEDKFFMQERNTKMHQQSRISESIHSMKQNLTPARNEYPYEKEKELLVKVKNGDAIGAKATLNELLGYVFFTGGVNMEVIKARVLELCTLLSRAAVEGGAVLDEIFGMNYKFITELSKIDGIEELSYWTLKVLDRFMGNVFNLASSKNLEIIKRAVNYINNNYKKNISLECISTYVHLNSSYFSTLFKKETGMRFSDYLNKVRIEESKKLLKDISNSILEVSLEVGFEDQSYYSKVFKKVTGMTPREYREDR
jgi:AraC-like DNA-binding protein/ligand-binding sensor protein